MTNGLRPRLVPPGTPLSRPLVVGQLHIAVELHADGEVTPIDRPTLDRLGITLDDAFEQAAHWLSGQREGDELREVDTVPGMWFLSCDDGAAGVRLAELADRMQPLGGILAGVPSRNQLLVVPVERMHSVEALRVMASAVGAAFDNASDPVSDQLFWHDGSTWHAVELQRELGGDVTVLPPSAFFDRVRQVASMEMVRVVGEA